MANHLMSRDPRDPFHALSRFDPFSDMDELMRDFFTPMLRVRDNSMPRMRVDISETEQAYMVKAEIPGVNRDDIKVAIDGNRVSISAELKQEHQEDGEAGKAVRNERLYGQQYRSFSLPQEVDDSNSQARYVDGVLQLTLQKKAGTGGKQLQIQ